MKQEPQPHLSRVESSSDKLNNHTVVASITSAVLVAPVVAGATALVASVVDFTVIMFQPLTHSPLTVSFNSPPTHTATPYMYPSTQRGLNLNSRFHYSLECTSTDFNCSSALACSTTTFDLTSTTQRLRLQSLIWLFNTMPTSHRSQDTSTHHWSLAQHQPLARSWALSTHILNSAVALKPILGVDALLISTQHLYWDQQSIST